jgi:hypothetical protein
MTTLHTGCRMKNIRKGYQRRIQIRLRSEVFVQHTIHDVQLPIPGRTRIYIVSSPSSQRRTGRMYYILKERRIIKRFAITAEEMIVWMGSGEGGDGEISKKNGRFKMFKWLFRYALESFEPNLPHLHDPCISHNAIAMVQWERKVRTKWGFLQSKKPEQKGVCHKEYP